MDAVEFRDQERTTSAKDKQETFDRPIHRVGLIRWEYYKEKAAALDVQEWRQSVWLNVSAWTRAQSRSRSMSRALASSLVGGRCRMFRCSLQKPSCPILDALFAA